jgi:hypothetical protein
MQAPVFIIGLAFTGGVLNAKKYILFERDNKTQ